MAPLQIFELQSYSHWKNSSYSLWIFLTTDV